MKLKIAYILVGAERRKGKDTFSKMLVEELERAGQGEFLAYQDAFANALKDEIAEIAEIAALDLDVYSEEQTLKETVIRPLLIGWGQARRHTNPGYWIDLVLEKANRELFVRGNGLFEPHEIEPTWMFVVISDWRFPNEYHRVQELGTPVIGIFMEREHALLEPIPEERANAPLCRELADVLVINDGDLNHLKKWAERIVTHEILPVFRGR